ncbi:hypothetical protein JB92DRAFT_288954 [Gautieria morchelliformis]|nr:hypothetical protein JB92DRAFT_288954 [Gautieria morchelliformis]
MNSLAVLSCITWLSKRVNSIGSTVPPSITGASSSHITQFSSCGTSGVSLPTYPLAERFYCRNTGCLTPDVPLGLVFSLDEGVSRGGGWYDFIISYKSARIELYG